MYFRTRNSQNVPAMASEPFLSEVIIILAQLFRILLSFLGFPVAQS